MSAQLRTDSIISDYKKRLTTGQIVVEAKLKPDNSVNIAKVLSINADGRIVSFEALKGEVSYSGRVAMKVMYLADSGAAGCLDYIADFSDKIIDAGIEPGSNLSLEACIVDTNATGVSAESIKVSCVVEVKVFAIARDKVDCAVGEIEGVYTESKSLPFNTLSASARQEFAFSNEAEISEEIDTLCLSEASVLILSAKPSLDSVVLNGKIFTNVVYVPQNGLMTAKMFEAEFTEELACHGAKADAIIDCAAAVDKWQVRAETFEGESRTILRFDFKIAAEISAYLPIVQNVLVDAYCIQNELLVSAESWKVRRLASTQNVDARIEGTAELTEGMPSIDKIMTACGSKINVANCYADTDRAVVEGVLNTNVVYFNREFESYNSVAVEIPYSVSLPVEGVEADNILDAVPCIMDISVRGGKQSVDVEARLCFRLNQTLESAAYCIKEMQLGEPRTLELNAVAVYITKPKQSVWDVAKALNTTSAELIQQNPALGEQIEGGERVIVYRKL